MSISICAKHLRVVHVESTVPLPKTEDKYSYQDRDCSFKTYIFLTKRAYSPRIRKATNKGVLFILFLQLFIFQFLSAITNCGTSNANDGRFKRQS